MKNRQKKLCKKTILVLELSSPYGQGQTTFAELFYPPIMHSRLVFSLNPYHSGIAEDHSNIVEATVAIEKPSETKHCIFLHLLISSPCPPLKNLGYPF